jgi:hypothetical protein
MAPRRELVPIEIAAVVAIAVGWSVASPGWPVAIPLLVAASASRYARGGSWQELVRGGGAHVLVGVVAGTVALAVAVVVASPIVEAVAARSVEWSSDPIVRGSIDRTFAVAVVTIALAVASELALRGWIVERVAELAGARGSRAMPILVGAIAEAALASGDLAARLGAAVFGAGLSWLYLASGRNVTAPIAARLAFQIGALVLEALRVVG